MNDTTFAIATIAVLVVVFCVACAWREHQKWLISMGATTPAVRRAQRRNRADLRRARGK